MSDLAEEIKQSDCLSVAEADDGDEALRLVGKERTQEFSEEYNKRLRRKLVRSMLLHLKGAIAELSPRIP